MNGDNIPRSRLRPGDSAPAFDLVDQNGNRLRLEDFRGRKLLVYFYPVAQSPDCTAQSCDLRDHRSDLRSLGIDVVGISPDPVEKQRIFDAKHQLGFPLLADEDHAVAERYGVWGDYVYDGQPVTGVVRSSFLIAEDGRLQRVWSPITAERTVPEALAALRSNG